MTRPKDIGTRGESAVVSFLRENGWPSAERRALTGSHDQGDVTGTPGIAWEVKSGRAAERASDGQITAWLAETEAERVNAGAEVGVLVVKRAGIGAARAGLWSAVTTAHMVTALLSCCEGPIMCRLHGAAPDAAMRTSLAEFVRLLRHAGYGTPLETESEIPHAA